jgi:hypothetical protein
MRAFPWILILLANITYILAVALPSSFHLCDWDTPQPSTVPTILMFLLLPLPHPFVKNKQENTKIFSTLILCQLLPITWWSSWSKNTEKWYFDTNIITQYIHRDGLVHNILNILLLSYFFLLYVYCVIIFFLSKYHLSKIL